MCVEGFKSKDKIYIDSHELDMTNDRFHVHLGHNVWVEYTKLERDKSGLFALPCNLVKKGPENSTATKEWRCPYCYNWYPIGKRCNYDQCPTNTWEDA